MTGTVQRLRERANRLKRETWALWLAWRHPRTPWHARIVVILIVAYALSPIDLIPDFIPILGYLDDLVLIPLGIRLAIRLIPPDVLDECRGNVSTQKLEGTRAGKAAAAAIILVWITILFIVTRWIVAAVSGPEEAG